MKRRLENKMSKRSKKPQELEKEEEEEDSLMPEIMNKVEALEKRLGDKESTLQLGDLLISHKGSLADCKTIAQSILRDKTLKGYLNSYKIKKIIPMGVG